MNKKIFNTKKIAFFNNLIKIVEKEGWNNKTLEQAVVLADLNENFAEMEFENMIDVIKTLQYCLCDKLQDYVNDYGTEKFLNLSIHKKIEILLIQYFTNNVTKELIKKTMKYVMQNQNVTLVPQLIWIVADNMWKIAGIHDTDFNFYSRRIILYNILQEIFLKKMLKQNIDSIEITECFDKHFSCISKFVKVKKILSKTKSVICNNITNRKTNYFNC